MSTTITIRTDIELRDALKMRAEERVERGRHRQRLHLCQLRTHGLFRGVLVAALSHARQMSERACGMRDDLTFMHAAYPCLRIGFESGIPYQNCTLADVDNDGKNEILLYSSGVKILGFD